MTVLSKLPVMLSDLDDIDVRYENGCIYILKHKTDESKECYIGSSRDFKQRCECHKERCNNENSEKYNLKVYKYIRENDGMEAWEIVKLYDYPCKNKYELELEERRAIEAYKSTLNHYIPTRTKKEYSEVYMREYRQNNKEKIAEKSRQYNENNKEKIAEKRKQFRENNREMILERDKQYYQKYKVDKNAKAKVKINCDNCNRLVSKHHIARHKRSNVCLNHK